MKKIYLIFFFVSLLAHKSVSQVQCPHDTLDDYLPDPKDCSVFYRCHNSQTFRFDCSPGTLFNVATKTCDFPYQVDCKAGRYVSPEESRLNQIDWRRKTEDSQQKIPVDANYLKPQTKSRDDDDERQRKAWTNKDKTGKDDVAPRIESDPKLVYRSGKKSFDGDEASRYDENGKDLKTYTKKDNGDGYEAQRKTIPDEKDWKYDKTMNKEDRHTWTKKDGGDSFEPQHGNHHHTDRGSRFNPIDEYIRNTEGSFKVTDPFKDFHEPDDSKKPSVNNRPNEPTYKRNGTNAARGPQWNEEPRKPDEWSSFIPRGDLGTQPQTDTSKNLNAAVEWDSVQPKPDLNRRKSTQWTRFGTKEPDSERRDDDDGRKTDDRDATDRNRYRDDSKRDRRPIDVRHPSKSRDDDEKRYRFHDREGRFDTKSHPFDNENGENRPQENDDRYGPRDRTTDRDSERYLHGQPNKVDDRYKPSDYDQKYPKKYDDRYPVNYDRNRPDGDLKRPTTKTGDSDSRYDSDPRPTDYDSKYPTNFENRYPTKTGESPTKYDDTYPANYERNRSDNDVKRPKTKTGDNERYPTRPGERYSPDDKYPTRSGENDDWGSPDSKRTAEPDTYDRNLPDDQRRDYGRQSNRRRYPDDNINRRRQPYETEDSRRDSPRFGDRINMSSPYDEWNRDRNPNEPNTDDFNGSKKHGTDDENRWMEPPFDEYGKRPSSKPQWYKPSYEFRSTTASPRKPTLEEPVKGYDPYSKTSSTPKQRRKFYDYPSHKSGSKPSETDFSTEDLLRSPSEVDPRYPDPEQTMKTMNKIFANDPYSMADLMEPLPCNETEFINCEKCSNLNWLKFPKIKLTSLPTNVIDIPPHFSNNTMKRECFKFCFEINCVAYSYNYLNGQCYLYTGPVKPNQVINSDVYVTVIREPITGLIDDQWLLTTHSTPASGKMAVISTSNYVNCLRACGQNEPDCKAVSFDRRMSQCHLFDSANSKQLTLSTDYITFQHKSLFENDDKWRFIEYNPTATVEIPFISFAIVSDQQCYSECLHERQCLMISIESRTSGMKECHLYKRDISTGIEDHFRSADDLSSTGSEVSGGGVTPSRSKSRNGRSEDSSWEPKRKKNVGRKNYLLRTPLKSTLLVELPKVYFTGNSIAQLKNLDLIDCIDEANGRREAIKFTYYVERRSCDIFSDAATVEYTKTLNQTVTTRSFYVNLPSNTDYLAFKRIIGLTLRVSSMMPRIRLTGKQSAAECLSLCLERRCSAVTVQYPLTEKSVECILFDQDEFTGTTKLSYYNNSELFIRTLPKEALANSSNIGADCRLRQHILTAQSNLEDFSLIKAQKEKSSNDQERYSSGYVRRYHGMDNKNFIQPHEYDFVGAFDDQARGNVDVRPYENREASENKRNKRSFIITPEGSHVNNLLSAVAPPEQASQVTGDVLGGILKTILPIHDASEDTLIRQFLIAANHRSVKPPIDDDIIERLISTARRARRSDINYADDIKKCRTSIDGENFNYDQCLPREICTKQLAIPMIDEESSEKCRDLKVNSTCRIRCIYGYKAKYSTVTCISVDGSAILYTKDVICEPDERICRDSPVLTFPAERGDKMKIDYVLKYDTEKRLPIYGIYRQSRQDSVTNMTETDDERRLTSLPCHQLRNKQLSYMNYHESPYVISRLVAGGENRPSSSINYFVNTAPQDAFTAFGPWSVLGKRLQQHLDSSAGYVVSGICRGQLRHKFESLLPVPSCFWRIVCTVTGDGEITAAAFVHRNTIPKNGDEKKKRVEEIMRYTDQDFVRSLIDRVDYDEIWYTAYDYVAKPQGKETDSGFINRCAAAHTVDTKHTNFWNDILINPDKGPLWPDNFDDEVITPAEDSRSGYQTVRGRSVSPDESKRTLKSCEKRIVGFLNINDTQYDLEQINDRLTHIELLNAVQIGRRGELKLTEGGSIFDRLYRIKEISMKKGIRVIVGLGAWHNSQWFSLIASNSTVQRNFITNILAFLDYWNFDGVDIIWQYPVIGGHHVSASPKDRRNYPRLLKNLKDSLIDHSLRKNRDESYTLSIVGPPFEWIIDAGFDLTAIEPHIDWLNIMAFDFYGPWSSASGKYTGPIAALNFGSPDGSPGKLNVESIVKRYVCDLGRSNKVILGLAIYGRYWKNVGNFFDPSSQDDLFRFTEDSKTGLNHPDSTGYWSSAFESWPKVDASVNRGGFLAYREIRHAWLPSIFDKYHNQTQSSFIYDNDLRILLSYESEKSIRAKINYALTKNIGGFMLWTIDMDDVASSLTSIVSEEFTCPRSMLTDFQCLPRKKLHYWTQFNGIINGTNYDRMCGLNAPLINGNFPICDPDNPGYKCCSAAGYCGTGPAFCQCPDCVDFSRNVSHIFEQPKPTVKKELWHTIASNLTESEPNCGFDAKPLSNGETPICNPDDPKRHCCSKAGFCGTGNDHCQCVGCVDFRLNREYRFPIKRWFDWRDGPEKVGRCGPKAPKINKNETSICNHYTDSAPCCNANGFCGKGPKFCNCHGCVDFRRNPFFQY